MYAVERKFIIVLLSILHLVLAGQNERKLLADLLDDYNKNERPVENDIDSLNLKVGYEMTQLIGYDESNGILSTRGWLDLRWKDHNLKWDPQEYGGIKELRIASSNIWLPDLHLYNSAADSSDIKTNIKTDINIIVDNTGNIFYLPPVKFESYCPNQLDNDTLSCELKFGSWTYDVSTLNIENGKFQFDHYVFYDKSWEKIGGHSEKGSKKYSCCPYEYPFVVFNLYLRKLEP